MALPSFVCLGFQKSGTTTLYALLKQHPGVELCRDVKEPMYYRVLGLRAVGGRRYYEKRYFGHVAPDDPRMLGEVNAGLTYTNCAKKVARDLPATTKFIVMMRNPVDRCYSAYKYFLARGFLPVHVVRYDLELGHAAAFDRYVHEVLDDPRRGGKVMDQRFHYMTFSQNAYATCIKEYLEHYDRDNFKFIIFEEFIRDQRGACRDLYDFLGLEDCPDIDYDLRENANGERAASPWAPKRLLLVKIFYYVFYEFLAMSHWAPGLMERFFGFYDRVRERSMRPDDDASKVLPETRAFLQDYYASEVRELERIVGRDLSGLWF